LNELWDLDRVDNLKCLLAQMGVQKR
jgi:hypothetical protein